MAVLDFFTVEYAAEDRIWGPVMALFSLCHIFVLALIGSSILLRRELHTIFVFGGLCLCELLMRITKKSFKHPRPEGVRAAIPLRNKPSALSTGW